ncbi:molybdopterin-dependent oxidoreductase [Rhizobium sp. Leaf341]|uniref:molybdopterin-dependent oxidoreductase n=1 Tax=Rhizobium sp. Leaf341 TaxID=1736344 RepID=UPI0007136336|nr:molybdopterin-dependent oxidoreductase [Rhizobium sp. Leaf341]KQR68771.1 molybdopterin oxidoreductase [Rhizobium sp. Leaf341]
MSRTFLANRRRFLTLAGVAASTVPLSGCDAFDGLLSGDSAVRRTLASANSLSYRVQRMLAGDRLAPEFSATEIRQGQRPNGSTDPNGADYLAMKAAAFATYRLPVTGLVEKPLDLGLDEIRAMPARTQITRHDCVEGWSCIAKWTGVPLATILDEARVRPEARYVVVRCYDAMDLGRGGPTPYYESIDLLDARHPQTILAYGCNDETLSVANGAPLRMRVERQLGYKMPKYIKSIELAATLAPYGGGKGGFWEDVGYDWYGGI